MTNEVDFGHLWTLFKDAHERSLDNILSHPLKAEDIEDLCEALGGQFDIEWTDEKPTLTGQGEEI